MSQLNDPPIVAFDSNVLSFFVEAASGFYSAPLDDPLREEKIAAFRLFLFCSIFILPTVTDEAGAIPDAARMKSHLDAIGFQFGELLPDDREMPLIARRAAEFSPLHSGKNDCLLLAQAEFGNIPTFVTFDRRFVANLRQKTSVRLLTPVEACQQLGIPGNAKQRWKPHPTNPLAQQTWWRW